MPLHDRVGKHGLLLVVDMHDKCYIVLDSARMVRDEHIECLVHSVARLCQCCRCYSICVDSGFFLSFGLTLHPSLTKTCPS